MNVMRTFVPGDKPGDAAAVRDKWGRIWRPLFFGGEQQLWETRERWTGKYTQMPWDSLVSTYGPIYETKDRGPTEFDVFRVVYSDRDHLTNEQIYRQFPKKLEKSKKIVHMFREAFDA